MRTQVIFSRIPRFCTHTNQVDRVKQTQPLYHFIASDGVRHTVWRFTETAAIEEGFADISALYVADGHHRSASAAKVVQNGGRRTTHTE